ncbi:MAG: thioesterase [Ignavibacteriaceae bacterium]|nr:thioesterase [Ignavibacteriaceae bacterium]
MISNLSNSGKWVLYPKPKPWASRKLFCFPYAGGSSFMFRRWPEFLPEDVEVCPVELPGRGRRISEDPIDNLSELISSLAGSILPHLNKPFEFFGHSMGALISFELARYLKTKFDIEVSHLYVSAQSAPHLEREPKVTYNLPSEEFIEVLRSLNGMPDELLSNTEMMQIMLPILRADFAICETYQFTSGSPLNCSITAIGGAEDDKVEIAELYAWSELTTNKFSMIQIPGDHFFLLKSEQMLLSTMSGLLTKVSPFPGT